MNPQFQIDFTRIDHGLENSPSNDAHYTCNIDRFNGHCKAILERLLRGERLSTIHQHEYGTGDLRARLRDLRKAGVPVKDDFITTSDGKRTRFKVYYLEK